MKLLKWPQVVAALCLMVGISLFSGCAKTYYQYYDVKPASEISKSDISITYDFWSEGGRMAFVIRNNTDKIVTIHTDKCFFVLNGMSNCHFTGEVVSESSGRTTSFSPFSDIAVGSIHTKTATIVQQRAISIAPYSSHAFSAYVIQEEPIRVPGLSIKPKRRKPTTATYVSESDSPVKFSNVITYSLDGEDIKRTIVDGFYVSSISNYHHKDFLVRERKYSFTLVGSVYRAVLAKSGAFFNSYIR